MSEPLSNVPELPCLCANFRRAARSLTQLYEAALRPRGLRATQFTVLQALSLAGEVSQGQLGDILALDSTTLTRTLALLRRRGWIAERRGSDRRERLLRLSAMGGSQMRRALPAWRAVQRRLERRLGPDAWRALFNETVSITALTKGGSYER
jgi:DNA-binding MarR family transcriptional regulator